REATRQLNDLFHDAARRRVSDVHLLYQEGKCQICFRAGGVLEEIVVVDAQTAKQFDEKIRARSQMSQADRHRSLDGRMRLRYVDRSIDVRVSVIPVVGGQASAHFLRNADSVGASGGLMGWLGFLLVFETLHHRLVPRSARRRLAAAVFLTALIGLIGHRFIDNAAHAGGLVAGMLYAAIVFPKSSSVYRPQSTLTDRIGGSLALAACAASAAFAIWKICAPA
ncbi:MAG: rhomboid family intramembrane serine protease, partial [Verrucomicrobiaceae bacterium]